MLKYWTPNPQAAESAEATIELKAMAAQPLNVLWLIDHVCFDGSLHAGGRLYMNVIPRIDQSKVRIHPYFMNASDAVLEAFKKAPHPVVNLALSKFDVFSPLKVNSLVRRHNVDVMHLFCFGASTFGRVASIWNRVPSVIHEFDTPTYGPYPPSYKFIDRLLLGRTQYALGASTHCRDFIHEQRHVPRDKIEVLYHAVPPEKFEIAKHMTRDVARQELGWNDGRFVYLTVTKLGPDRGNETLLEAFAEVRKRVPNAHLCLIYRPTMYHRIPVKYKDIPWIGDPVATRRRIVDQIQQLGLSDSVTMVEMEAPERHEPYFAASDVMVVPFESPLFSSVNMIESMLYGLTQVVTDLGEPADIAERWGTGIKVPPKNPVELAKAMIDIAQNTTLREALTQKVYAASIEFGVDAVAERLSRLYLRVADARQLGPERMRATG
jgi:glycosyltransferase involved in cell wall biosynthesis